MNKKDSLFSDVKIIMNKLDSLFSDFWIVNENDSMFSDFDFTKQRFCVFKFWIVKKNNEHQKNSGKRKEKRIKRTNDC